ncbi:MAG: type II/IV secretion system protein [Candidatus Pacebacteria bacterium]|nr:type II/IV secretion system protein [Candidatus Paceibacterota bacterium]
MKILPEKLKEIVLKAGFVGEEDFNKAAKIAEELEKPLVDVLIFRGLINEESLGQLVAEHYQVPFVSLAHKVIPLEILSLLPEKSARSFHILPFGKNDQELFLAMEDPEDFEAIELVKRQSGLAVKPFFATSEAIVKGLSQYKKNIRKEFEKIITENVKKTKAKGATGNNLVKAAVDVPVVRILDTLLEYAIAERASDIHIELLENELIIRYRIDGMLRDIISLPVEIHSAIVARVKVLTHLKIDEHRLPQDGRFKFGLGGGFISLRVSIIPAFYGENIVMRLLFESARPLSLEELGLSGKNFEILKENIKKPHGMILVTGPTGSGKTTTLYSLLNMINSTEVKICTVEDPIEYSMPRITQIQANPETGLSFAAGIRALVRHDPDIIMVGEIRDPETVEMAINSALTGHLVLSTLHTNDAPGAVPRLLDMGAENFLVASTVNLVIAQRLVRRICSACIQRFEPDDKTLGLVKKLSGQKKMSQDFYRGKGCEECGGKGYRGRVGIFEILETNAEIRQLILKKVSSDEIRKAALANGMIGMVADGLNKVAAGITTIEEILRMVQE